MENAVESERAVEVEVLPGQLPVGFQVPFEGPGHDILGQRGYRGLSGEAAELATGQATLGSIAYFPAILIVCFIVLYVYMRNRPKESVTDIMMDSEAMAAS